MALGEEQCPEPAHGDAAEPNRPVAACPRRLDDVGQKALGEVAMDVVAQGGVDRDHVEIRNRAPCQLHDALVGVGRCAVAAPGKQHEEVAAGDRIAGGVRNRRNRGGRPVKEPAACCQQEYRRHPQPSFGLHHDGGEYTPARNRGMREGGNRGLPPLSIEADVKVE